MAKIKIDGGDLVLEFSTLERVGALHDDVRVPTSSVRSVTRVSVARREVHGFRAPGTGVPGMVRLGTFRGRDRKTFAAAYRDEPGYVIDLDGAKYDQLVVSAPIHRKLMTLG